MHGHDPARVDVLYSWQLEVRLEARLAVRWSGTGGDKMRVT